MRRTIPILTAALGLAVIAGCTPGPQRAGGTASPVGAAGSISPATTAPASAPAARPSSPAAPSISKPTTHTPAPLVLGPTGLGKLKIGMSASKANATGMLVPPLSTGATECEYPELRPRGSEHPVVYSPRRGVISIPGWGKISTPEGIRIGSTLAQVKKAYDDFRPHSADDLGKNGDGRGFAGFNDSNNAHYRFEIDNRKVTELWIEHDNQDCYE
jgi:hypothetical protein